MKDAALTRKADPDHRSAIALSDTVSVGGDTLLIVGGPCAVESAAQMEQVAQHLSSTPVQALRGGVFKPRTSPYAFQGMGEDGLQILADVRQRFQMPVISEVMAIDQIELMADYVDVLQVGSRNMQNFDLLKALGRTTKPVLLKRGLAATIEEFVMAAEYILSHGNPSVVLCERGIRSFDPYTRNVLDLGAVVALKQITHLPVMVDPSHAAGKRELVPALARAAIAAGADGLIIECHPVPDESVSDARQALTLDEMATLARSLDPIAAALGRRIASADTALRPEPGEVAGAILFRGDSANAIAA
ncbi:3-deoxy-7-phosphoheptulonate synthase [Nodosilinea sp. LEGE 06152]|uniref:3-deoxy-7-phosphoheptulonate synthase n=1 Tax=Nodosilinea sp. LEGE 06152 TaxID=2777966 RepID=UPI0018830166|nr:3-deoxy-7-phosphoheptulonate synthase [Nodosilinea sp. LEGE 06152]MBE9155678.1 3-deoxy-7-phosphoheptulonate synthase [Nodosilinea sp. LEGE 06152]